MTIKVAIIGCGAVGSLHAANLMRDRGVELVAVYSPASEKASDFAFIHGIKSVSVSVGEAIAKADVAIISSPTDLHFQQARECVEAGVYTLVEFPPCANVLEAEELGELARKRGKRLGCAHTARYLHPYARVTDAVRKGLLGEIRDVNYIRYHQLRRRSWTDNALLHHAAHSIDLLMDWCGGLEPVACVALPNAQTAQVASILGKLPSGGPAAITVSYASHLFQSRMLIIGKDHTAETDGFSYLRSDLVSLQFQGTAQEVYEQAIRDLDADFIGACRENNSFVNWAETVSLIRTVNKFQALCNE